MTPFYLALSFSIVWVVLKLIRKSYGTISISSACFFKDLPEESSDNSKARLSMPQWTTRLFIQLFLFFLFVLSLFPLEIEEKININHLGMRLFIDTSHSMTIERDGVSRIDAAIEIIKKELFKKKQINCIEIYVFNETAFKIYDGSSINDAIASMSKIKVSTKGTNISLIGSSKIESDCNIDEVIVVSDFPNIFGDENQESLTWIDIGYSINNFSLGNINQDSFTKNKITIKIQNWSNAEEAVVLNVKTPNNLVEEKIIKDWDTNGVTEFSLDVQNPGEYFLTLADDDYSGDDQLLIEVPEQQGHKVSWESQRLEEFPIPYLDDSNGTVISVADVESYKAGTVSILIGKPEDGISSSIDYFPNEHILIDNINLDDLEKMSFSPKEYQLPINFKWILYDKENNRGWLATKEAPRAVYLPPISFSGEALDVEIYSKLFFQALHWVSQEEDKSIKLKYFINNRIHQDKPNREGERSYVTNSQGGYSLKNYKNKDIDFPYWYWLLSIISVLILLDQYMKIIKNKGVF